MLLNLFAMPIDIDLLLLFPASIVEMGNYLQLQFDISAQGLVLAQQFQNVDILGNIQTGWDDFLKTGKAGALAVGLVMGYMIRGITR